MPATVGQDTWWKSFTTGKTAATLGGIPHDTYGMTSLSIRQFVLGIYKQLGLREKDVTKVQTGGPDGDLGSSTCSDLPSALVWGMLKRSRRRDFA
jgi:glutamate dehydrogenase